MFTVAPVFGLVAEPGRDLVARALEEAAFVAGLVAVPAALAAAAELVAAIGFASEVSVALVSPVAMIVAVVSHYSSSMLG
jgi:hypothetical protein